ncbi:L-type lectin-domain containing receptor kinase S.1 [Morus notabilis]|uniref:non-specific serine/threonine protein kinase n=1 Tax=Morus notabilis TaxID=981085 RepID=W9RTX0_9ROSA|nr:L-type lectin-domain containing receptor kinase S.1 [Morus notabilis]EXB93547.1 L-type lectin-domain containing receptor kinase S.1 [Morus notabilis]
MTRKLSYRHHFDNVQFISSHALTSNMSSFSLPASSRQSPDSVRMGILSLFIIFHFFSLFLSPASAIDFLLNSFSSAGNSTTVTLINDARFDSSVVRLTNDSNQFSFGRAFYPTRVAMRRANNTNSSSNSSYSVTSFSTSFVFSILPEISTSPGFGLCFVLSNYTSPPGALASQYFGLFTNAAEPLVAPLFAVEFDAGRNTEFNDPDDNHIGIDLNNIESAVTQSAGYYNSTGSFVPILMKDGRNVRAWIEFDGENLEINVTVAPIGVSRPSRPTLTYRNPAIVNYLSEEMFVGFSASKTQWVEAQRILAWSFSDTGAAREINTTNLPIFLLAESSSSLSSGAIAGIAIGCVVFVILCASLGFWLWRKRKLKREEENDDVEDWELDYWPHRISYEELYDATNGFSADELLGSGGFGKVYRGTLLNNTEIAVKCVNHDSKQGLREFMAEISSMGRLQHKNLVQMRGWCRRKNILMLVYDCMPNGSLNRWIFDKPKNLLSWDRRRRVLADVAEGLSYLHHGYDKVVVHRDIKSSNILLDSEMRGRLGDFGLAKLYGHNEAPNTTRVVGTLGYMAPELATVTSPTAASDVYSFGVVVLEVACGRRPIEMNVAEEEVVLIDWVRDLYVEGRVVEAADKRIRGEYEVEEMEVVLKLGLASCHPDPQRRPTMREVVAVLIGERAAAAATPAEVLSVFSRGDRESAEVATPLHPQPPASAA